MECFEAGLINEKDTGGIKLTFGNAEALVPMVEKIAHREGIGALLAEGSLRAAKKIGRGAERFAMHVKGQDLPMHEPRFKRSLAINYAISPTGADHCHALHDSGVNKAREDGTLDAGGLNALGVLSPMAVESLGPEKVRATLLNTMIGVLDNCLGICLFVPWSLEQKTQILQAATGWNVTSYELMKVAERAWTLARVFNLREGLTAADDRLPERFYGPTTSGALAQGGIDRELLQEAVQTSYAMMGWDRETGAPLDAKLHELDIHWAAQYLPKGK
jgi:aldehyde:ferredoxin oxidoreductase